MVFVVRDNEARKFVLSQINRRELILPGTLQACPGSPGDMLRVYLVFYLAESVDEYIFKIVRKVEVKISFPKGGNKYSIKRTVDGVEHWAQRKNFKTAVRIALDGW